MKKILILLEITNEEIVEAYGDVHPEIIMSDLQAGTLINHCGIVNAEVVDA